MNVRIRESIELCKKGERKESFKFLCGCFVAGICMRFAYNCGTRNGACEYARHMIEKMDNLFVSDTSTTED